MGEEDIWSAKHEYIKKGGGESVGIGFVEISIFYFQVGKIEREREKGR
jgi:hypothetical protein